MASFCGQGHFFPFIRDGALFLSDGGRWFEGNPNENIFAVGNTALHTPIDSWRCGYGPDRPYKIRRCGRCPSSTCLKNRSRFQSLSLLGETWQPLPDRLPICRTQAFPTLLVHCGQRIRQHPRGSHPGCGFAQSNRSYVQHIQRRDTAQYCSRPALV